MQSLCSSPSELFSQQPESSKDIKSFTILELIYPINSASVYSKINNNFDCSEVIMYFSTSPS